MSDTAAILAASMLADTDRLRIVSQNMANASTPGYKARLQGVDASAFDFAMGQISDSRSVSALDRSVGAPKAAGRALDLMIDGPALFQVQVGDGVAYTRRGDLMIDAAGVLVTSAGQPVLGTGGPIRAPSDQLDIRNDGRVEFEGQLLGRIALATFSDDAEFQISEDGLIRTTEAPDFAAAESRLLQGQLEASNVKPAAEMSHVIETVRHFSLSAQALRAYDQMLGAGIDGLGQF